MTLLITLITILAVVWTIVGVIFGLSEFMKMWNKRAKRELKCTNYNGFGTKRAPGGAIGNPVPERGETHPPKPKYKCLKCGSTKVSSGTRYSITIKGRGVVQVMECSDCGTEIEEEDR